MLRNMENFPEAEQYLKLALQIDPKQAAIHRDLVNGLINEGKVKDAMIHMEKAVELKPDWMPSKAIRPRPCRQLSRIVPPHKDRTH